MSKERPTIGTDGKVLPLLPPTRDARVCARMVRVMFYTPGFMAVLLLKTGEPTGFGISIELLMLASAAAVVAGLFIATQSVENGGDYAAKTGTWSGSLVLELLAAVPFLCAVPSLFHELSQSTLLHKVAASSTEVSLGVSELLPAVAILPFMLYQLGGVGTMHYVVSKGVNWVINLGIFGLIVSSYVANRLGNFAVEKMCVGGLVLGMALVVIYGVMRLRRMQEEYDLHCPRKVAKGEAEG